MANEIDLKKPIFTCPDCCVHPCVCDKEDLARMRAEGKLPPPVLPDGRPSWDAVWMSLALTLSQRSTCDRAKVGCVVVSKDNHRVLAVGYNGGAQGVFNECQSSEPGKCGHLHAEINALIKMNYNEPVMKKLYTTTEPCFSCAVAIINANINEIVYLVPYRTHEGLDLLKKCRSIWVRAYEKRPGEVPVQEDRQA
ncbi:MAG: deoxycytidylate deaminase [Acidiferrobacterales bacterium]